MHVLNVSSAEKANSGEDPQRTDQQQHWEAQVSSGSRVPKATARLQTGESWYPGDDAWFLETLPESLRLLYCSSWRTLQMCAGGRQLPVSVSSADSVPQKTSEALPAHAALHREQHSSAPFTRRKEQQQRGNSGALETLVEPPGPYDLSDRIQNASLRFGMDCNSNVGIDFRLCRSCRIFNLLSEKVAVLLKLCDW